MDFDDSNALLLLRDSWHRHDLEDVVATLGN